MVAEIAARMTGEPISHHGTWRILQAEGTRVRTEEGELVSSVFELGEAPPDQGLAPELVVIEADGTFVRAQLEEGDRFEIKTGVFLHRQGSSRRPQTPQVGPAFQGLLRDHRRSRCLRPGPRGPGVPLGGLHRARHVLCVHDGLDGYGQTFSDWFPRAHHQVDHFHVAERVWQVSGADAGVFAELRALAFSDPEACARKLRRSRRIRPEDADELAGYLTNVGPHLHGIDRLPRRLRRGRMHIVGSGLVEKHQDLLVKRRMKGAGMRWTRKGADNLLALQARRFCDRWPTRWGVVAS